jgi:hypothetical protein
VTTRLLANGMLKQEKEKLQSDPSLNNVIDVFDL